jgi:predicted nucleic acid-binding protein
MAIKETVYVETTVIGYLTSRPRQDVMVTGHQEATREWWRTASDRFDLFVSQLVVQECSAGDEQAAQERLDAIEGFTLLPTTVDAEHLAAALIGGNAVPETHPEDALHVALAAVHGIEYLVTWNFRHIANASVRAAIERICRDAGHEPPIICTLEELMEP